MPLICTSELNKLTCFQQCLEKSISTTIDHLKKYANYEVIPEMFTNQEKDSEVERQLLHSNITKIIDSIKYKINFLKQNNLLSSTDLQQFKNEMIMIQDAIQNLMRNSKLKLKALNTEYIDINQDLDFYREKLLEWAQPINIKDNLILQTNYKRPFSDLKCIEIREFIDFVRRSGGHENGWDKEDHQLFLKIRNKFKEINIVAQKINELLPDKSLDDVKEHEAWYKKYLLLKRNKKDAIKRWQESKNKTKLKPLQFLEAIPDKPIIHFQEDLKDKLLKWKLEKELQIKNALAAEEFKQQKVKELENLRKKRNEEMKKVVEEWKAAKISIEKEDIIRRKTEEEIKKKHKAAEANKLIKQFQSQDDSYILKMRQQKKRLEVLKPIRSKSSQTVKRDPDRVFKPTKQWINRVHDENIYPFDAVIPLKKLPKLGIPEWRKKVAY